MADIDFKEHPLSAPLDFQAHPIAQAAEPSALEAGARGLAQGATLGFGDELYGAGSAGVQALKKGSLSDAVADYIKSRDEVRANNERARKAHPYAYGGAELVGGVAPAVATGGGLPALGALGATAAVGTSDSSDPATLATQGVIGGAGAAVGGAALEAAAPYIGKGVAPIRKGLSDVGEYIAGKLGRGAEDLAVRHLRPTAAMTRKLGPEAVRAAGREALDSGAIGFGSRAETTASRLGDLVDEVGAVKGDIVNGSKATINPSDIANRVHNEVVTPLLKTAETQPLAEQIEGKAQNLLKQYPGKSMTPAELEAEKMAVQSNINYGANSNAQTGATRDYARVLREGVEGAVNDPAFPAAKESFGNLRNAQEMAERTANTSHGGLADTGVNVTALAHPNPLTLGMAGTRALTKGRMTSAGAVALDKSSEAIRSLMSSKVFTQSQLSKIAASPYFQSLRAAGDSGGPAAVATTHYVLQQTDPGYQQLLKDEQK